MLEIINLEKEFNGHKALNGISFNAQRGKIFGLLGPNGAGKTTAIRIILDIIKPSKGEIKFDGNSEGIRIKELIGYLPEERGLYKKSKIIDIIKYFAELKNVKAKEAGVRAMHWLDRLGLKESQNKKLEELSKGNQQKVQFITSIIHNPEILILDEPFSGFDPFNQETIKNIISEFIDSGKIIILSTHMLEIAEQLCDELLLINEGNEVLSGSLADIKKKFGTNTYKLIFSGDEKVFDTINGITTFTSHGNKAYLTLHESLSPSALLKKIIGKVEVEEFTYIEPTLTNIFFESLKRSE